MKKIIALALSTILMLGLLSGCATPNSSKETYYTVSDKFKNTSVQTITEGKLTVAVSPDFAPMEFVDPTKTGQDMYVGFDVILAHYIADSLGLELVLMPMSFDACQTAVYTGTVDMSISGFSWTPDREKNANLSNYYYAGDNEDEQVLITLKSNAGKYDATDKLNGVKIGAQNASLQQNMVTAQLPDSKLELFTDLGTAVLQLKNGDFDCIAVAGGNADAIIANNPEIIKSGFCFYVDPKETGNVILLQKGADTLTDVVNQILAESEKYWGAWYAAAEAISGIDQSYDDDGNVIAPSSGNGETEE
jgi:polar amino acid transport system substrate-binding protein